MTRHPKDQTNPLNEALAAIFVAILFALFVGFMLSGILHVVLASLRPIIEVPL